MKRIKKLLILLAVLTAACVATVIVMHTEEKKEQIRESGEIVLAVPVQSAESLSWTCGETALAFHRTGDGWRYDGDDAFPVDEAHLEKLLSCFESLTAAFVIEDADDLSQYGLTEPTCTVELTADGETHRIGLGLFSTIDAQRYFSVGDGNVYLAAVDPFPEFDITLPDLIRNDPKLVCDGVLSLAFAGAQNYTLTRQEDGVSLCEDDVYFTESDGAALPLDTKRVESYLTTVKTLGMAEYASYSATDAELAAFGLDAPELTVTAEYAPEEGKTADYTLTLGRDQAELAARQAAEAAPEEGKALPDVTVYYRIGDSGIIYKTTEAVYDALMASSVNDLRHQEVLPAAEGDFLSVVANLDGGSFAITSDAASDGTRVWHYLGEETDASEILKCAKALRAAEFTDEEPTGKEEATLSFRFDSEAQEQLVLTLYRRDGSTCLAAVDGVPLCLVPRKDAVALIESVYAIILN